MMSLIISLCTYIIWNQNIGLNYNEFLMALLRFEKMLDSLFCVTNTKHNIYCHLYDRRNKKKNNTVWSTERKIQKRLKTTVLLQWGNL